MEQLDNHITQDQEQDQNQEKDQAEDAALWLPPSGSTWLLYIGRGVHKGTGSTQEGCSKLRMGHDCHET